MRRLRRRGVCLGACDAELLRRRGVCYGVANERKIMKGGRSRVGGRSFFCAEFQ